MRLNNLTFVGEESVRCISINNEIIESILSEFVHKEDSIDFEDAIAFPGLVNSHDHLDFNCFPKLGNYKYKNYIEWGTDIHEKNADTIEKVLKIPKDLRIKWGIYKNLLNGFTTVVNHGPELKINNDLITIFQDCYSIHSIQLEKRWRFRLNNPLHKNRPYVIHVGEGTDEASFKEISTLLKWNLFNRPLIGIHGVAMTQDQATEFKALIWCPYSNDFLLGANAPIQELKKTTKLLFGTDSCVSSSWNLWKHLNLARETGFVSDEELFKMLTSNPAGIWGLSNRGKLGKGMIADIVIAKKKNFGNSLKAFFDLEPEDILLVFHKGNPLLFDNSLKEQLRKNISFENYSEVKVNGKIKFIKGNLPKLLNEIQAYYPDCFFPVEV